MSKQEFYKKIFEINEIIFSSNIEKKMKPIKYLISYENNVPVNIEKTDNGWVIKKNGSFLCKDKTWSSKPIHFFEDEYRATEVYSGYNYTDLYQRQKVSNKLYIFDIVKDFEKRKNNYVSFECVRQSVHLTEEDAKKAIIKYTEGPIISETRDDSIHFVEIVYKTDDENTTYKIRKIQV